MEYVAMLLCALVIILGFAAIRAPELNDQWYVRVGRTTRVIAYVIAEISLFVWPEALYAAVLSMLAIADSASITGKLFPTGVCRR